MTGTFVVDHADPSFVEAMVTACLNQLSICVPEITAMPEIFITEVTYTLINEGGHQLEVWFREPDGSR